MPGGGTLDVEAGKKAETGMSRSILRNEVVLS